MPNGKRRWGRGWKINPHGRARAWDELERYSNDPQGYLDKIAVNQVRSFESGLLSLLRNEHGELLGAIAKERALSSELEGKLIAVLDDYSKTLAA